MTNNKIILTTCFVFTIILAYSCKHKVNINTPAVTNSNFPTDVANIFITKCAVSGCHNAISYSGAGGLRLDTWENLFNGGSNGAVVVPYSADFSSLLYFINTDENIGIVAEPTMPINNTPLSLDEYNTIKKWIASGAPNINGDIPFANKKDSRQKIYTVQQECDVMAVIDAEKNVVMRYLQLGKEAYPESMSDIRFSPNGNYLYLCYWYSPYIQKIDVRRDTVVAELNMGNSFWSTMNISRDGSKIIVSNEDDNSIKVINTTSMKEIASYTFDMVRPRSVITDPSFNVIYASSRLGNTIYKITNNTLKKISLDGNTISTRASSTSPNPWSLYMAPNNNRYFVTCAQTNEVKVMDAKADTLIKSIPVGIKPQEMAIDPTNKYLFVTCMDDPSKALKSKGSVYVINYETLEVVKRIEDKMFEPYGLSVDEKNGLLYVFSKNLTADGPAPHHGSPCNGRNGFYNIFDINTLLPNSNKRYEILVNPGASQIRF